MTKDLARRIGVSIISLLASLIIDFYRNTLNKWFLFLLHFFLIYHSITSKGEVYLLIYNIKIFLRL